MKKKKRKRTKGIEWNHLSYVCNTCWTNILLISHPFPDSIILIQKYPDKIYEVGEKISRPLAKRERDSDVESRVVVSDKRTLQFSILKIHPSPCNIPVRLACHGNHPRLNNRSSCACILTHFDLFVRRLIRPPTTANYNSWTRISRCGD